MSNFEKYIIRYGCVVLKTDAQNQRKREVYLYEGQHIERGSLNFELIEKFADENLIGSFNEAVHNDRIQIIGIPFMKEVSLEEAESEAKVELEQEEEPSDSEEGSVDDEKPVRRRKSSK